MVVAAFLALMASTAFAGSALAAPGSKTYHKDPAIKCVEMLGQPFGKWLYCSGTGWVSGVPVDALVTYSDGSHSQAHVSRRPVAASNPGRAT